MREGERERERCTQTRREIDDCEPVREAGNERVQERVRERDIKILESASGALAAPHHMTEKSGTLGW